MVIHVIHPYLIYKLSKLGNMNNYFFNLFKFLFILNSLRQFRIQPINYQNLPICQPCLCYLNVSDGRYVSKLKMKFALN